MKKLLLLCMSLTLLFSCSQKLTQEDALFNVKGYTAYHKGKVNLSSLFPKHRIIPLETNDSSLIEGRGNKVIQQDSLIYIQSKNVILCFHSDGRFMKRFDKKGKGPEDYIDISDFDVIDAGNGNRELWLSGTNGIKIYDAFSGEYLRNISIKPSVKRFKYVNDRTLLVVTPTDTIFHVCDLNGNIRKSFMEKDLANSGFKYHQFFEWDKKIAYQLDDTQTAIVYNPDTDECMLSSILPVEGNILTPEINRDYYNKYGYMEQCDHVSEDCMRLSAICTLGDKAIFTEIAPGGVYSLTLLSPSGCNTYLFSELVNDICPSDDELFLATLISCKSNKPSTLLFRIPSESTGKDENNFWLLEVEL